MKRCQRVRIHPILAFILAALALSAVDGCKLVTPADIACTSSEQCPISWTCGSSGRCVSSSSGTGPGADGGSRDGGGEAGDAGAPVTTLAGNGTQSFADGEASAAEFDWPHGVAVDANGNVYVADYGNNRIRQIHGTGGTVSTVAGNGKGGIANGTAGLTGMAEFDDPSGVAVDPMGNIYIADTNNNCIRLYAPAGMVSSFAGSTQGFVDGMGIGAEFFGPTGVAIDTQGNVYVADEYNSAIRVIDSMGNVTTLAGNGTPGDIDGAGGRSGVAEFNFPQGVAVDSLGNVYVADSANNSIRKIDSSGTVTTLAGNGTRGNTNGPGGKSGAAEFDSPAGVAVDSVGNVYVADYTNNEIRKIDTSMNVTTLAGSGAQGFNDAEGVRAEFNHPSGVAVDPAGNVYVGDTDNNRVRKISP